MPPERLLSSAELKMRATEPTCVLTLWIYEHISPITALQIPTSAKNNSGFSTFSKPSLRSGQLMKSHIDRTIISIWSDHTEMIMSRSRYAWLKITQTTKIERIFKLWFHTICSLHIYVGTNTLKHTCSLFMCIIALKGDNQEAIGKLLQFSCI